MEKENPPPPNYGATVGGEGNQPPYPQPGQPYPPQDVPSEPPPKYEGPQGAAPPQVPTYQQGPYTQPPVVGGSTYLVQPGYGPHPVTVTCPYCGALVTTTVTSSAGAMAWLIAGLLCLFGCWLGCCLIPFCITDLHDCTHTCPSCNRVLGHYRRL